MVKDVVEGIIVIVHPRTANLEVEQLGVRVRFSRTSFPQGRVSYSESFLLVHSLRQ